MPPNQTMSGMDGTDIGRAEIAIGVNKLPEREKYEYRL
jgi:hypothetical protein